MNVRTILFALIAILIFFGCSPTVDNEPLTDYPNSHLLLDAAELNQMLQIDEILLIYARSEVSDSLIPGSIHFPSISELTDPDHPVDNFLIGPELFQEKMRATGLNKNDRVVIYDEGNSLAAARLFYALDYYGFSNASILNGGIQGWLADGYDIVDTPAVRDEGNFSFNVNEAVSCDITYVMEAANNPDIIIVDARSEDEYTGRDERAERSGHIPNAVNLEWSNVLQQEGIPYFLPAQEIQDKYTELGITPDKEIIPHCHTNVRGSHAYFTLRLMGYDSVRPYEGSWAEYGNNPDSVIQ
jgi:thiosulfate/3-mercaptopyruvate sulfurtransferase